MLRPDGVYAANLIDYEPLGFARAELRTLREVFDHVALAADPYTLSGRGGGNLLAIASDAPLDLAAIEAGFEEQGLPWDVVDGDALTALDRRRPGAHRRRRPGRPAAHAVRLTPPTPPREDPMTRTALVLGGGGVTGIAWELGLLHGLAEAGVDLTTADLVVGTSAGSVVGAQVTTQADERRTLADLYAGQLRPATGELAAALGLADAAADGAGDAAARQQPHQAAPGRPRWRSGAPAGGPGEAEPRVEVIRGRLRTAGGDLDWPDRDLVVTAVAADTGELVRFTRGSGADLTRAVAASCAVPWSGRRSRSGAPPRRRRGPLDRQRRPRRRRRPGRGAGPDPAGAEPGHVGRGAAGARRARAQRRGQPRRGGAWPTSAATCSTRPSAPTPPGPGCARPRPRWRGWPRSGAGDRAVTV